MDTKKKQALKDFLKGEGSPSLEKAEPPFKNQSKKTQASQKIFIQPESLKKSQELEEQNDEAPFKENRKSGEPLEKEGLKSRSSQPKASSGRSKKSLTNKPKKSAENRRDNYLKPVQARRLQMMSKMDTHTEGVSNVPLQIQLMQSESLKISQEKINNLEDELLFLREKNESLLSAADLLKEQNQELKIKAEESEKKIGEEKIDFEHEKEILLSALSSAKEQIEKLKKEKKELDSKLSNYSYSLSHRENSLEGRIEILKMENSVLQREKDKKIIELRKSVEKNKRNLEAIQKQNQELRDLNEDLQRRSHRAVSALRATIFNLEGIDQVEDQLSSNSKDKQVSQLKKTS